VTVAAASRDDPVLSLACGEAFEAWLERNGETSRGAWLKIAKKNARESTVTYAEAVEAALCFGWIDGQKARFDDRYWLQRFSPRTARSPWSKINREKAERLIAEGRMRPSGRSAVENAKADGRWDAAYAGSRTATVPADLQRRLAEDPEAAEAFAALDASNRYAIIWRLGQAKRPETRERRLFEYVQMLRAGKRIHP
jgi:uncharacterized protein YdeI (YjbR/CyaY-like superfamily)